MLRVFIFVVTSLIMSASFAHPGHDHSAPMSGIIHLLWISPLIIAGSFALYKVAKNRKNPNKQDK